MLLVPVQAAESSTSVAVPQQQQTLHRRSERLQQAAQRRDGVPASTDTADSKGTGRLPG